MLENEIELPRPDEPDQNAIFLLIESERAVDDAQACRTISFKEAARASREGRAGQRTGLHFDSDQPILALHHEINLGTALGSPESNFIEQHLPLGQFIEDSVFPERTPIGAFRAGLESAENGIPQAVVEEINFGSTGDPYPW